MESCFLFHTSIPLLTLEQQTEKGADCACPPPRDPLSRIEGDRPLQVGESRHGQSPRLWTAVMACLCSSSLSAASPSCLHLDISVPSFCLARGHAGTVPAGVCALLPAASWNCVGLGGTPIPEALDCALASPSYLPQINKSIASECVPYQMNSPIAKYSC